MISCLFDYATPSAFESTRERNLLGLAANLRRGVRFRGRVQRQGLFLRLALQSLGQVIWSVDPWVAKAQMNALREDLLSMALDPVVTVHPDRIFFEAFSQDQSVYGLVVLDRQLFEVEGEVQCGTTNVDFTAWLWAALGEMRSSRQTWLHIEPEGVEIQTRGAGGRFERKAELPDEWVRGFLQLQEAMALPGTRLSVRPVDLLAALRFLRYNRSRLSPRALRYEFEPGQEARLVLEPWEEVVPLKGTEHNYEQPRVIRTWGRRRLNLLEPLLPYASSIDIYLKGRALPAFYAVKMPGVTFLLGLSGWSENRWTGSGSFDLLTSPERLDRTLLEPALDHLRQAVSLRVVDLGRLLDVNQDIATQLLTHLCRQGRVIYDIEQRVYRHRELFEFPLEESLLFPPDPRRERAHHLLEQGPVQVRTCQVRETRKTRSLPTPAGKIKKEVVYREWQVQGLVVEQPNVEIIVTEAGRIIFGTCGCRFFKDNYLNQGPCEHLLALLQVSLPLRQEPLTAFGRCRGRARLLPSRGTETADTLARQEPRPPAAPTKEETPGEHQITTDIDKHARKG